MKANTLTIAAKAAVNFRTKIRLPLRRRRAYEVS